MKNKIVPDIVSDQKLTILSPDATVQSVAEVMAQRRIGACMVAVNGRLTGIISERDITTRVVAKGLDPKSTTVRDVMTSNPTTIGPDDTAEEALTLMTTRGFRHLPVMEGHQIIGIVSIRDLYAAIHRQLSDDIQEREAFIFGHSYGATA